MGHLSGCDGRGVLAILPCSRTECTLRASNTKGSPYGMSKAIRALRDLASNSRPFLRLCSGQDWADPSERLRACFFEPSRRLLILILAWAYMRRASAIFNRPIHEILSGKFIRVASVDFSRVGPTLVISTPFDNVPLTLYDATVR